MYAGDALQRREMVAQDIVKVGKDPRSHLRVDDELASRMHAVIEVAGSGEITLIDLGSDPGTLVNGASVNKCKLHVGDQIQIGNARIVLEGVEPATADARAAASSFDASVNPLAAPASASAARNPFASSGSENPFQMSAQANPLGSGKPGQEVVPDDAPPDTNNDTLAKSGSPPPKPHPDTPRHWKAVAPRPTRVGHDSAREQPVKPQDKSALFTLKQLEEAAEERTLGTRNESSVLFSLSALLRAASTSEDSMLIPLAELMEKENTRQDSRKRITGPQPPTQCSHLPL